MGASPSVIMLPANPRGYNLAASLLFQFIDVFNTGYGNYKILFIFMFHYDKFE